MVTGSLPDGLYVAEEDVGERLGAISPPYGLDDGGDAVLERRRGTSRRR